MLDRVFRHARAHLLTLRIHRAAVDGPETVRAIEVEGARDTRRRSLVRETVKTCNRRRVDAVVRDDRQIDDDLEDQIALARRQYFSGWTTPVFLLEPVLDVERLARVLREVDDQVGAFSHADTNALNFDRSF